MPSSRRKSAIRRNVGSVFGNVEAHPHMALCGKVVHLVGLDGVEQFPEAAGVGHVGEMKAEAAPVFVEIACKWRLGGRY